MFNDYETLKCSNCERDFTGRKSPEGIDIFCQECLTMEELPIVDKEDIISGMVNQEFSNGRGSEEHGED